jgi:hypothetical protein
VRFLVLALGLLLMPLPARADDAAENAAFSRAEPAREPPGGILDIGDGRSFGWFTAGALTGFLAHEGGHLFTNFVYGNVPRLEGMWSFGFVPFFAISPRIDCDDDHCVKHDGTVFHGGPRGKLVITSAGFSVQHLTDEILLTREPNLRYRYAPYRKGLLAFNILLSVGYALCSWTRIEDPHGDVSRSAQLAGLSHEVYAGMLILPALFDLYRYFKPDSRVAPWLSRGAKGAFLGVIFAAPN